MDQFNLAPINEETASKLREFVDNVNEIIGKEYDTLIVQYDVNRLVNFPESQSQFQSQSHRRSHTPVINRPVIYQPVINHVINQPVINQPNSNFCPDNYLNADENVTHEAPVIRRNVSNKIIANDDMDEEKNKKKKTNKTTEYVIGAILISTVSVVSTWIITSDGYVKLWREGIDDKLNELEMFNLRNGNDDNVEKFVRSTKEWLNMLKKRKKSSFVSKIGLITSAMSMAASYFAGPTLLVGGILGCGISGCYYVWNQFDVSITKEKRQYSSAMSISSYIQTCALMQSNIQVPPNEDIIPQYSDNQYSDNQYSDNQYGIPQYSM